ncbi:MAG: Ig-like domain-containing protein [Halioglobus sp.]|nr:Ig-like domain-containing protein [Halioglobus sp.]
MNIDLGEASASVELEAAERQPIRRRHGGSAPGLRRDDIPSAGFGGFRKMRLVSQFPPVAVPVEASVRQIDAGPPPAVSITLTGSELNGAPLTYEIASSPAHGSLGPLDGNTVSYTPDPGFTGVDSFTYRISNGSIDSEAAEVSVRVYADDRIVPVGSPIDGTEGGARAGAALALSGNGRILAVGAPTADGDASRIRRRSPRLPQGRWVVVTRRRPHCGLSEIRRVRFSACSLTGWQYPGGGQC